MKILLKSETGCMFSWNGLFQILHEGQGSHGFRKVTKKSERMEKKSEKMKIDKKSEKIVKKSENFDNFSNFVNRVNMRIKLITWELF